MKSKTQKFILKILFFSFLILLFSIFYKIFTSPNIFDFYKISSQEKSELLKFSKSQLQQDIFVYLELDKKRNGFFVEFGATNGIDLSNSYMLEQEFGWRGILAEPGRIWQDRLKNNRPNSVIENLCIWNASNKTLTFNQAPEPELATIEEFSDSDGHAAAREQGERYEVKTITLYDLLKKHKAPQNIDYLSIDTEGSELEILEAFFNENKYYKIKIITCEHNYTSNREKIYKLLTENGYERKYDTVSKWDDFYILKD